MFHENKSIQHTQREANLIELVFSKMYELHETLSPVLAQKPSDIAHQVQVSVFNNTPKDLLPSDVRQMSK